MVSNAERTQRRDLSERRLGEAFKYVARGWMPVQAPVLKDVQRKLAGKLYEGRPNDLIADLRNDFSLFTYCFRQLGQKVAGEDRLRSPLDLLRSRSHRELTEIFGVGGNEVSSHDFIGMKEVQLMRLKHQLVSCATVELIAEKQGIDVDVAVMAALFRQLGVALVAWNYPSTCAKALSTYGGGPADAPLHFDDEISTIVGFDPHRLGKEFLLSWNADPVMRLALARGDAEEEDEEIDESTRELGDGVRRMCQVGEALARTNDPNFYPRAVQRWREVEGEVIYFLGQDGLDRIREHLVERYAHYVGFAPKLLGAALSPQRQVDVVNKHYAEKRYAANEHAQRCPEPVKVAFKGVYDSITQNRVSTVALNGLVGEVVPKAGFLRGCVYILDPKRMVLVPRLRLGETREYRPVSCACGGERSHPVSEAFHCSMPIVEENVFLNGDFVSHVTGKFGNIDKVGILYLEMTEALREVDRENRLLYFKAIRQCLNDCLNLH